MCSLSIFVFSACNTETKLEFPEGLAPLQEMQVELPIGSSTEPYPQEINLISETTEEYTWVQARGYLHQDLLSGWTKIRDPEVYVDINEVTTYTVDEVSSDLYDYVFVVHNEVEDIITVNFDTEWRHGALSGDISDPQGVAIRWQKTEGTNHISLLEGSLQFFPVEDDAGETVENIIEVQFVYHLAATLEQEESAVQFVTDVYERWRL